MRLPKVFDDRKVIEVTRKDLAIASLALGFTMGFGFLTTWYIHIQKENEQNLALSLTLIQTGTQ